MKYITLLSVCCLLACGCAMLRGEMTDEEWADWKIQLAHDVKNVVKTGIEVAPIPEPTKGIAKDFVEWIVYLIIGAGALGYGSKKVVNRIRETDPTKNAT